MSVRSLLRPNTDPHDFEPRPSDISAAANAKVVFANGLGLDEWIGEVVDESGADAEPVELGDAAPVKRPGEGHEGHGTEAGHEEHGEHDPHWFHDPRNAEAAVERIRTWLAKVDPANAAAYGRNANAYLRKLRALDAGIERCIASVPSAERKLVTDHDAFGYFTERYGIRVVGAVIPSQSTQAQPSAGDTADLARTIEREGVKAIFPEESLNPDVAEALADQTGITAEYHLYGDTLGPGDSRGSTYLGMQQANADAMVRGFTGGARGCPIRGIA